MLFQTIIQYNSFLQVIIWFQLMEKHLCTTLLYEYKKHDQKNLKWAGMQSDN